MYGHSFFWIESAWTDFQDRLIVYLVTAGLQILTFTIFLRNCAPVTLSLRIPISKNKLY